MSRARTVLSRAALVIVSTGVALGIAEVGYRATRPDAPGDGGGDDGWTQRYRRMNETIYMRSTIDGLVYEPRPSSTIEMEYGVAGFDSARRRWDGSSPDETADRIGVALIGDSLAWSEMVSVPDSLAVQLERALGDGVGVSNFGVSGYATMEEARYFEARVAPTEPDLVVLVFCLNDFFRASGPYGRFATDAEAAQKDEQDRWFDSQARVRRETIDAIGQRDEAESTFTLLARARSLIRRARFDAAYTDEYLLAFDDDDHRAAVDAGLARLGAAIRASGARAVLVISPMLEAWDAYRWSSLHAHVREVAERAGFTVIDPLDALRAAHRPEDLRFPGDQLHYGPDGNRALADVVAGEIRSRELVPSRR
ncbi:MAG: SGNH/GDSL hydrolase family protein [Sandaracinaceae bacterium]